jgi:hypothetical protein
MASADNTPTSHVRSYDRREIKNPLEQFAADMCRAAGVRYRGIQKGFSFGDKHIPAQVMFDNNYKSTLCLPITGLSIEAIRGSVAASNELWERGSLSEAA